MYSLSIDPATHCAGVSLFKNNELVSWTILTSNHSRDNLTDRMKAQVTQLEEFLQLNLPKGEMVGRIIMEDVRSKLLILSAGAYLTCPYIDAKVAYPYHFISPSKWKSWARRRGASGNSKEIKGLAALRMIKWDFDKYPIMSDDVADSVMQYYCWWHDKARDKDKGVSDE